MPRTLKHILIAGLAAAAFAAAPALHAQNKPAPAAVKPAPAPSPKASPSPTPTPTPSPTGQPTAGLSSGQGPVDVTADESLEYHQSEKAYVAHGNAVAHRGDRTIYADTLSVYYRDIPNTNQTEPWRYVADGHVRVTTPTQEVVGDHGIYDIDTKTVVMTGKALKLTAPSQVVTARDSLEWYDDKQLAVARGDALAVRTSPKGERRMRADVLVAQVAQAPGEAQRISRVDGEGHVVVSAPDQVGTGDKGVYNVDTGISTLTGHVTLARGDNTLVGDYGVMDTDRGLSRLLPHPPTDKDRTHGRVQGYIVPKKKPVDQQPAKDQQPSKNQPGKPAAPAAQKAQP